MAVHPDKTAFRAVDACGGTFPKARNDYDDGWQRGHEAALDAAIEAVQPVDALMAELLAALEHIAALEVITDASTGHGDDAAQATARAAIAKATQPA